VTQEPIKPAEASLLNDPATTDLAVKVKQAWSGFGQALTDALGTLPPGTVLDITLDPTAAGVADAVYDVTVSSVGNGELHAYAVSNALLPPEYRLPRSVIGELVELGWTPPGLDGDDRFSLRLPVDQAGRVAAIVTRTFRDAYGSPHPAFLRYRVVLPDPAEVPTLGAARPLIGDDEGPELAVDLSVLPLPEKVAAVIAAMLKTTPENLPVDKDGDIGIRSGSAMVFVRVRDNPPLVDVFSPVLTGVDAGEELYAKLSDLTHRMPIGRLYCTGETVWASVPVFGRDFQATHLMLAVQVMTGLADELDDRLRAEFGGKRFWVDTDRPGVDKSPDERTGFYI
jgi:hypothetical protein